MVVTASIGISSSAPAPDHAEDFLRNADAAMYRAKNKGKAHHEGFDPSMHEQALERLEMEHDLRRAIDGAWLSVHYQPRVELATGHVVGVEALARWTARSQAPPIAPEDFVPLAEGAGLARALTAAVAARAAAELAPLWGRLRLRVSINLPLGLLVQPDLPVWLGRALRGTGMRPEQMVLELTETTAVRDRATLRHAVLRLRAAGYRTLLDDLELRDGRHGLLDLPFSGFKLDRGLVEALPHNVGARQEVRRLVRLAEARRQVVVAEGVSDARLWAAVRGLGVHLAQGFGVGRPLPAAALPSWWVRWRAGWAGVQPYTFV